MNTPIYTNKDIAELLAESKWKLGDGKSAGRVGGNILMRYMDHKAEDITHEAWEQIELFVKTWTSAKNYTDDSSASSNTVVDPLTELGKSKEVGTYYRGPLERKFIQSGRSGGDQRWRIIQTLFKGAGDTESEFQTEDGCAYKVYRHFYVDQPTIPSFAVSASSGVGVIRNFQLDPLTGFYNGYYERKSRLYQTIAPFYTMQDAFEKAQLTRHIGVRDGDLDENGAAISPAIPDPTAQSAGTLVEVARSKNSDCTQDINVVTKTAIEVDDAATSDRKEKFETVVSDTDVNQSAAVTPSARADGTIVTVENKKNAASLYDVTTNTRTAVAVPNAQLANTYSAFEVRAEDTDRNTVLAATLPTAQVAGTIKTVDDQINDFGRHDIKTVERTAVEQTSAEASDTRDAFQTVTEVGAVNAADALTPGEQVAGTIVTAQSRLNDFAKYDTKLETRTAVPQAAAGASDTRTLFETVAVEEARNADSAVVPVDQVAGTIKTVKDSLNDFLKHDTSVETRTAVKVEDATQEKTISLFETDTLNRDIHQETDAIALETVQTPGIVKTVRKALDEFGKETTDEQIKTATPVPSAIESKVYTPFESRVTTVDRHTVADPTLPSSQTAGTIVEKEDRLTDFNDHDVTTNTRTAVKVEDATQEKTISLFETDTLNRDIHQETDAIALETVQTPGIVKTVRKALDEFGKETTDEQIKTATPVPSAIESRVYDKFESVVTTVDRHTVVDPTLKSSQETANVILEEEDKLTDFNDHDVTTRTRTAIPVVAAVEEREYNAFESRTEVLNRNTVADPTLKSSQETAGVIVTERDTVTPFNGHDIATTTRTAVPVLAAIESKVYTPFESRVTTVDRHTVADPTLPSSQTAGTIVEKEDRLTDFNDHDVTTNTRTAETAVAEGSGDTKDYFSHTSVAEVRNATDALTPGDFAAGTIVTQDSKLNDFALYDTKETTEVADAKSNAYVSAVNDYSRITTSKFFNADSIPDASAVGDRVEGGPNKFGKFDYTKTAETAKTGIIGGPPITWSIKGGYYVVRNYTNVLKPNPIYPYGPNQPIKTYDYLSSIVKYQRQKDFTMGFYASEVLAYAAITGGVEGSYVAKAAEGVWKGVKAVNNPQAVAAESFLADPWADLVEKDTDGDGEANY